MDSRIHKLTSLNKEITALERQIAGYPEGPAKFSMQTKLRNSIKDYMFLINKTRREAEHKGSL